MMEATRQTDASALLSSYIAFPDLLFEKQTTKTQSKCYSKQSPIKRQTEEEEEEERGDII